MSSGALVQVYVEESEVVSRDGMTRTTYLVQVDRVWRPAYSLDRAVKRSMPTTPGVIWSRQLELTLPVGTCIERVVDMTRRDAEPNTSDVLFGRTKGLRQTRRHTRYVVAEGGKLKERG